MNEKNLEISSLIKRVLISVAAIIRIMCWLVITFVCSGFKWLQLQIECRRHSSERTKKIRVLKKEIDGYTKRLKSTQRKMLKSIRKKVIRKWPELSDEERDNYLQMYKDAGVSLRKVQKFQT